jgi:hypothetical protein
MASEAAEPDVRALWQNQVAEGGSVSAAEISRRSQELQDKARRRVVGIYAIGAVNGGLPLILMWFLPELRLGLGYLAVTALFLVAFVRRRSDFREASAGMAAAPGLAFYRRLLERERDFRRDSTRWFTIGPALNILVLCLVYIRSPLFHGTAVELSVVAAILSSHVILLTRIVQRLRGEARRYQSELDALSSPAA